jgi:hypothetical protein
MLTRRTQKSLNNALQNALLRWQLGSRQTIQLWLRGYCAEFAKLIAKIIGPPAELGSVLANDGNVHHIVVLLDGIIIDARGVNTNNSLISEINRTAKYHHDAIRAVAVVRFEREHERSMKTCPARDANELMSYLKSPEMMELRKSVKEELVSSIALKRAN